MTKNRIRKPDVAWVLPEKKRPIAYMSKATSDLIVTLSSDGKTILEVLQMINYDSDAKKVLSLYVSAGYGNAKAADFFK